MKVSTVEPQETRNMKMDATEEKIVKIEAKYCKLLHAKNGEKLRRIQCMFDRVEIIPSYSYDEDTDILRIFGEKQDIDAAVQYLVKYRDYLMNICSIKVCVGKVFHKDLIGEGGAHIRPLEQLTSTQINVPDAASDLKNVEIIGTQANVEKARDYILKYQRQLVANFAKNLYLRNRKSVH